MAENNSGQMKNDAASPPHGHTLWRAAVWVVVGVLLGLALVAAFFAYGQPELLLEQMNLRYCG